MTKILIEGFSQLAELRGHRELIKPSGGPRPPLLIDALLCAIWDPVHSIPWRQSTLSPFLR